MCHFDRVQKCNPVYPTVVPLRTLLPHPTPYRRQWGTITTLIACNLVPGGKRLRILREAAEPEHFQMLTYLKVFLRIAPVGEERMGMHESVKMFGMLEGSRRGRLLLRREVCSNMTCRLPTLIR
jgi:hypothetical protein